jgi:hypothetical protein
MPGEKWKTEGGEETEEKRDKEETGDGTKEEKG